jgi:hypothetical protein
MPSGQLGPEYLSGWPIVRLFESQPVAVDASRFIQTHRFLAPDAAASITASSARDMDLRCLLGAEEALDAGRTCEKHDRKPPLEPTTALTCCIADTVI